MLDAHGHRVAFRARPKGEGSCPSPSVPFSGQPAAVRGGMAGAAIRQDAGVQVDLDVAPFEVPADELLGERVFDVALDGTAQRSGPVRAVLAGLLDDPVDDVLSQIEVNLAIHQV